MSKTTGQPFFAIRQPEYGRFELRANPFSIAGINSQNAPYPLIEQKVDEEVREFVTDTLHSEEYCGLAVLGEFGSGKTYALRYIQTLLRTIETRPDTEEVLAIYIERPPNTILGLVREACDRIGRTRLRNTLLEMVFADLAKVRQSHEPADVRRLSDLAASLSGLTQSPLFRRDPLAILSSLDAVMNPASAMQKLHEADVAPDFLVGFAADSLRMILASHDQASMDIAQHMAQFAVASRADSELLWKELLRGNIMSEGKSLRTATGQKVWAAIMSVLTHAGYHMVYWLIDEFEELEYQQRKEAALRAFLADVRDLIDANLQNFAVVLSSKVGAWELYGELAPAFTQRFARVLILAPHRLEELDRMIRRRLASVRQKDYRGEELLPFTKESVKGIFEVSMGNTRTAVQACHILLWHVATTGTNTITRETVQKLNEISRAFFYAREGVPHGR